MSPSKREFHCKAEQCRSPTACAGFGYCRERNFDGYPMDEAGVARRRRESDEEFAKQKRKRAN